MIRAPCWCPHRPQHPPHLIAVEAPLTSPPPRRQSPRPVATTTICIPQIPSTTAAACSQAPAGTNPPFAGNSMEVACFGHKLVKYQLIMEVHISFDKAHPNLSNDIKRACHGFHPKVIGILEMKSDLSFPSNQPSLAFHAALLLLCCVVCG